MIAFLLAVSTASTVWLVLEEARLRGAKLPDLGLLPRFPEITFQLPPLPRPTAVTVEVDLSEQYILERHRLTAWLCKQGATPKGVSAVILEVQGRSEEPAEAHGEMLITAAEDALGLFLPRNFERRPPGT